MTTKEAIEYIEALKNSDEILDFYYAEEFIKAFEIAIRALEKQEKIKSIITDKKKQYRQGWEEIEQIVKEL